MKNRCKMCHNDAGNYRICPSCYQDAFHPCPNCGKPTPGITLFGKQAVNTCRACTSHFNADTHRIGKTCLVCKQRFPSRKLGHTKSVCDNCMKIIAPCRYCGQPMPKYKEKGGERKYCSLRCAKLAHPVTSEQAIRANKTKRIGHVFKSHQNKRARENPKYDIWRREVFERDNYTCQDCGANNHKGNGETVELHPHHIEPFATNIELRYEVSNGITLCKSCHRKHHNHVFIGRTKKAQAQS